MAHALERRYLRKVFFGFSRDAAGKDLLEEVGAARFAGCWADLRQQRASGGWQGDWMRGCNPLLKLPADKPACAHLPRGSTHLHAPHLLHPPTADTPTRALPYRPHLMQYVFSFSYDEDGGMHMAAGGSALGGKEFSTKDAPSATKASCCTG